MYLDQTAYYDDEGDEGGESLQQRYRDGAQGGLYKEEEEEEADRHAQLAPNSIYREEVRDSAEEEEDEGEGERGRGGGLYRQYADYEGDERDVMGYRGRDSQLVYPEEQEYEQREEAKETPDRGEEGEEDDDGYRHHRYREEDDDDDHRSRYKQEESRHRRRRPPPSYVDYDPDYYDVSEDDHHDRFSDALASRDDGVWDDYFDGHRKDIDYDIGDLIQNDESYGPDEGAADQSGKQPQAEEGERRREQPPPDYEDEGGGGDDERQRYRSNDEEEEEEEDERGGFFLAILVQHFLPLFPCMSLLNFCRPATPQRRRGGRRSALARLRHIHGAAKEGARDGAGVGGGRRPEVCRSLPQRPGGQRGPATGRGRQVRRCRLKYGMEKRDLDFRKYNTTGVFFFFFSC